MAATSEPAPGSVTQTAPIFSPRMAGGRYFFFCASVPRLAMWLIDMSVWTRVDEVKPPKVLRDSSSARMTEHIGPSPPPP